MGLVVLVLVTALAPDPVPVAATRLWALAILVAGAAVTVVRTRAIDLAAGPTIGVAALAGGILPSLAGLAPLLGLPLGALAGAAAGALTGATIGRVGRTLGALATLALGTATVAVLGAVEVTGGVVGFHAVGLPTALGDRVDAAVIGGVAVLALVLADRVARSVRAAAAAVAAADPTVARAEGRSPAADAACTGAGAGALLGLGGAALAMVDGSVVPSAYGLELTATVLAAAAVGGTGPLGAVLGTALAWGPSTVVPLSPLGALPVLLTAGPVALVVLAVRGGRPLIGPAPLRQPAPTSQVDARVAGAPAARPAARPDPAPLELRSTPTPSGPVDLDVGPGEVVAVVGPNGAGKSTLLARIGGQLPDAGTVQFGGTPAPRGPRRRARAGVARTWQRLPDVAADDLARLHPDAAGAGDELARLVARRPRVALLDEPTRHGPDAIAATLTALRAAGAATVLVDHRPEVVALADRVLRLEVGP